MGSARVDKAPVIVSVSACIKSPVLRRHYEHLYTSVEHIDASMDLVKQRIYFFFIFNEHFNTPSHCSPLTIRYELF